MNDVKKADTSPKVIEAIEAVIDRNIDRQSHGDDTFLHCLHCDEWEGHVDGCPIEALQNFLKEDE